MKGGVEKGLDADEFDESERFFETLSLTPESLTFSDCMTDEATLGKVYQSHIPGLASSERRDEINQLRQVLEWAKLKICGSDRHTRHHIDKRTCDIKDFLDLPTISKVKVGSDCWTHQTNPMYLHGML